MTDEKLADVMSEGRAISAVDNVIFPVIEQIITDRVALMISEFAGGKTEFVADVAYIAGLRNLQITLKQKQERGNRAFEKLQTRG